MSSSYNYTSKAIFFAIISLLITPFVVFAQADNIDQLISTLTSIITSIIPVVVALAILFFFWGLAKFILHADDETKRAEGKQIMIWGIIALFVIFTIWGIIVLLQNTFIEPGDPLRPTLPT
ncbi:hypothetical protein IIB51_03200 [Patescibacteria group bacterium]|nr:hypothetical protein [Patescibacteria group bacterium]MCH8889228.1 hypothetical protein [Patescibacteria group bacterium]